jgi:hypothetical protein
MPTQVQQIVVMNQLPANAVGDYMTGKVVSTIVNVPQTVQAASNSALSGNSGRMQMLGALLAPGSIPA